MPELCCLSESCASPGWYGGIVSGAIGAEVFDFEHDLCSKSLQLSGIMLQWAFTAVPESCYLRGCRFLGDIDPAQFWWGERDA
jgi:hypothetical protein